MICVRVRESRGYVYIGRYSGALAGKSARSSYNALIHLLAHDEEEADGGAHGHE